MTRVKPNYKLKEILTQDEIDGMAARLEIECATSKVVGIMRVNLDDDAFEEICGEVWDYMLERIALRSHAVMSPSIDPTNRKTYRH